MINIVWYDWPLFFLFLWKWSWVKLHHRALNTSRKHREKSSDSLCFPSQTLQIWSMCIERRQLWRLKVRVTTSPDEKGSWKTSLTFSLQQFKNNTRRSISVTFTAMGKATNITSKAHYAIFWEGRLLDGNAFSFFFFFFSRPLHVPTNFSIQQHFPISALLSQTWMERLNQFSSLKKKGMKKKQTVCVELSAVHALRSQRHGKKKLDSAVQSTRCSSLNFEKKPQIVKC